MNQCDLKTKIGWIRIVEENEKIIQINFLRENEKIEKKRKRKNSIDRGNLQTIRRIY